MESPDVRHAYVHKDTLEELKTIGGRGIISGVRRDVSDVQVVVLPAIDYAELLKLALQAEKAEDLEGENEQLRDEVGDLQDENDSLRADVDGLEDEIESLKNEIASLK